jgi:hypothetical protein
VPSTALNHFKQDVARAQAIVAHAGPLPAITPAEQMLRSDLLRSAWMFAVGAMDAYFCDAYTDIVAATIISKSRHPAANLPDFVYDIRFPIRAILEPYTNNENWRWRMAARKMMERENVLSLSTVQTLFNKFFRGTHVVHIVRNQAKVFLPYDNPLTVGSVLKSAIGAEEHHAGVDGKVRSASLLHHARSFVA